MATAQKTKKEKVNSLTSFFAPVREKKEKVVVVKEEEKARSSNYRPVSLESYTIILLEEVDVLFDSDKGFWSAVYDLISTTRRPLILTSNIPWYDLDCSHIKIEFEKPSLVELGVHIQLLCLSHDYHMTYDAAISLGDCLNSDLRQIFLNLQFWLTGPSRATTTFTSSSSSSSSSFSSSSSSYTNSSTFYSLDLCSGRKCCNTVVLSQTSLPRLSLPWQSSVKSRLSTSDLYRSTDMASYCSELHSYVDVMEVRGGGVRREVDEVWWCSKEEKVGLLDELGEEETRWREEEVEEGVCEEVKRRVRESVEDPISRNSFIRHVSDIRHSLEKCSRIFSLNNGLVGVATDGLPLLRSLCSFEHQKQLNHAKRRFRHYLQHCATVEQTDLKLLTLATRFHIN